MSELPGIDPAAVTDWIARHVEDVTPPLAFSVIAGGHSNLTYGVDDAEGRRMVLRRGPLGAAAGRAHDMGREYRAISALAGSIPVPGALALCDDDAVIGSSFYLMSRVDGAVVEDRATADASLPDPAARRRAGEQVVDVLADLAAVDVDGIGLGGAAKRDGFLDRQIRRFQEVWDRTRTRALPAMDRVAVRVAALAPPQRYTSVVHGDYRIGNTMIDEAGRLVAVLDWELWTLGDVLADLGFLLNNWYEPDDPTPMVFMVRPPTASGDFGTRDEVLERYARRTGFDVSAIDYYRGFQHWRMAVIAEGVKRRYESKQMASTDVDFGHLERRVNDLVGLADHFLDRFERPAAR